MGTKKRQPWSRDVWALARRQHWVVTRAQLLELGMGGEAIRHRLRSGRLHRVIHGAYVVGRPEVSQHGRWMAAVLVCGPLARLSHRSAAALLGIHPVARGQVEVVTPGHSHRRRRDIRVRRRVGLGAAPPPEVARIPVTDVVSTLVDLATCVSADELERAVSEADHHDLIDPESLRYAIDEIPSRPGVGPLRRLLDRHTFVVTDTELERRFLPIARAAGLPPPQTQVWLNGYRVDFYWPDLGLVVEADSLRYHRTPMKQAADNRRDQVHTVAGLRTLRFSHWEVFKEARQVRETLTATVATGSALVDGGL